MRLAAGPLNQLNEMRTVELHGMEFTATGHRNSNSKTEVSAVPSVAPPLAALPVVLFFFRLPPGGMANQGAKKRKEENARHMSNLLRLIIACNVIYIVVRALILYSSFTWKHWIGLILTTAAYVLPYQQLANMAKPTYADDGELEDGGFDMRSGGVCEYLHDIIYITSFVQIASIFSGKFWYTYLVIPAFGAYKASGLIKAFLSHSSEGIMEDEKSRKKREKMERKATRGKIIKARAR
ncbi:hypothetical protein Dimus_027377 [Dionaea muscipula]